jgi:protein disulfide-isomerase A1
MNRIENGILILTKGNFKQVVFNSKEDVLVKFYAPWCGHCKKLVKPFEELAERL